MSQKWFRLKCIRSAGQWSLFLAIAWASGLEVASASALPVLTPAPPALKPIRAQKASPLPAVLKEIEAKYAKANTLSADFSQTNQSVTFSKPKTSTGKIFVKRPSKFRWETEKPDPNLVITNREHVIYYTPPFDATEPGQLVERKVSEVQSRLVNTLMSGSFSIARDVRIAQKDPTHFVLTPKKGTAATVKTATIEVNPGEKVIQKITLTHQGGNTSEIQLSNIQFGIPLKEELFAFTPPPNTTRPDLDH